MALSKNGLQAERDAVRGPLRAAQSLNLPATCESDEDWAAAVIGLFQLWLFAEGARELGAEEAWRGLTSAAASEEVTAPDNFALDCCCRCFSEYSL